MLLRVPARTVLHSDEQGIPTGSGAVGGTEYDFSQPRAIAATKLDTAFTDLERDQDGLASVELRHPDHDAGLALGVDERYSCVMLYTGDDRPDVNRRSLAVEPMTCPPNAFRAGDDLIVLEPDGSVQGVWGSARSDTRSRTLLYFVTPGDRSVIRLRWPTSETENHAQDEV